MKIGIIGFGSIGSYLGKNLKNEVAWVVDADPSAKKRMETAGLRCPFYAKIPARCGGADLAVEAASQEAVPSIVKCLPYCDIMLLSVGALKNVALLGRLYASAKRHMRKIYIPSGAIGGMDAIVAAGGQIASVLLETKKDPASLGRRDTKRKTVFSGSASRACEKYPKNVNVAATLSLAGIGFDKTQVRIISDPKAKRNMHRITVKSKAGSMTFAFENEPFEENPKTSKLAALSALARIRKIKETIQIG